MEESTYHTNKINTPNLQNQFQPTNELSRFGHSVTLRKLKIIIIYFILKF